MGIITISMKDDVEKRFRQYAKEKHGNKKGYLGEAITEAVREKLDKDKSEKAREDFFKMMKKGYKLGGLGIKHRSELYDRS